MERALLPIVIAFLGLAEAAALRSRVQKGLTTAVDALVIGLSTFPALVLLGWFAASEAASRLGLLGSWRAWPLGLLPAVLFIAVYSGASRVESPRLRPFRLIRISLLVLSAGIIWLVIRFSLVGFYPLLIGFGIAGGVVLILAWSEAGERRNVLLVAEYLLLGAAGLIMAVALYAFAFPDVY